MLDTALAALDTAAMADDLAALVRVPSVTGSERPALELLAATAERRGLRADLHEHDLAGLRAHTDHPGEEADRDELVGLAVTLPGSGRPGGPRLCLDGHVDVVAAGSERWRHGGAFSGALEDGLLYGRGAADMKAGVVAALHALAAVRAAGASPPAEVVLVAVSSEEDGGLGTFAALERDDRFDAAIIPEPTAFEIVCAHAGALTFRAEVRGRAAHAGLRLEGRSALDRYVVLHERLAALERARNDGVDHPLMAALPLPYPLVVGRIAGGTWASTVPDLIVAEGRLGVRVRERVEDAMAALEGALSDGEAPPVQVRWEGGRFAPAETPADHPLVALLAGAVAAERGARPPVTGVPWGADMRLFTARGIPCAMVGTGGLERAHGVDERVALDDVEALARVLVRAILGFGAESVAS